MAVVEPRASSRPISAISTKTESAISSVRPLKARSPKRLTFDMSGGGFGTVLFT